MAYLYTPGKEVSLTAEVLAGQLTMAEYGSKTLLILRDREYPCEDNDCA